MNVNRKNLLHVLVGLVAFGSFAVDALAMYNPATGTFMSRDPGAGAMTRIGAGGPAIGGGFAPRDQYRDGMNLYQYVRSSPANHLDPTGLGVLDEAIKRYLQRVFGAEPYLLNPKHPTTVGPGPLAAGVLWGLIQAQRDAGREITPGLVADRSLEFIVGPQAIAIGTSVLYEAIPNATTSAMSKWGAVGGRAGLYAAAVYVGWQIGTAINNKMDDIENEIDFYNLELAYHGLMRSQGKLMGTRLLKEAPRICCGDKVLQIDRGTPRDCGDQLVDHFGTVVAFYGMNVWNDINGAHYKDFKARNGVPGTEDPSRKQRMADGFQTSINRYFECVKKHCGGKITPYAPN